VDLAVNSAERIFARGVARNSIDGVIFITQSADYALPTSACIIQNRLGLPAACLAFDMNLGCSGFIYGLAIGASLIETGICRNLLVVCADTYTKYIHKNDRVCRPIFSDAAAATRLTACETDRLGPFVLGTDGSGFDSLIVPNSGSRDCGESPRQIQMNGPKVFMFTMAKVPECIAQLLTKANLTLDDVDLFVLHQASLVVMENIIRRMNIPPHKVFSNLQQVGNTVSASIPIALEDARAHGLLKADMRIMLVGFGVGYSWGATLIRWREHA
jgi:3-oxoacyl-[acyl-carrier-protein] synthase-3